MPAKFLTILLERPGKEMAHKWPIQESPTTSIEHWYPGSWFYTLLCRCMVVSGVISHRMCFLAFVDFFCSVLDTEEAVGLLLLLLWSYDCMYSDLVGKKLVLEDVVPGILQPRMYTLPSTYCIRISYHQGYKKLMINFCIDIKLVLKT